MSRMLRAAFNSQEKGSFLEEVTAWMCLEDKCVAGSGGSLKVTSGRILRSSGGKDTRKPGLRWGPRGGQPGQRGPHVAGLRGGLFGKGNREP